MTLDHFGSCLYHLNRRRHQPKKENSFDFFFCVVWIFFQQTIEKKRKKHESVHLSYVLEKKVLFEFDRRQTESDLVCLTAQHHLTPSFQNLTQRSSQLQRSLPFPVSQEEEEKRLIFCLFHSSVLEVVAFIFLQQCFNSLWSVVLHDLHLPPPLYCRY